MRPIPTEVLEAMAVLGKAWPSWKVDDSTVEVWNRLLADIQPDAVLRAAIHFARTSEYPPTPAAIRNLVKAGDEISAEEAWEQIRLGGKPPNECAARALKAIGNPFARGTHSGPRALSSEMGMLRAHFRDAYNAFLAKEQWHAEEDEIETLESFNRADLLEMDRQELQQINGDATREDDDV